MSYVTELLGLGGWSASRGRHRRRAVGRVLLWGAGLVNAIFRRRVSWACPRRSGVLQTSGANRDAVTAVSRHTCTPPPFKTAASQRSPRSTRPPPGRRFSLRRCPAETESESVSVTCLGAAGASAFAGVGTDGRTDVHICSCCPSPPLCASWSPSCSRRSCGAFRWPRASSLTGIWSYSEKRNSK